MQAQLKELAEQNRTLLQRQQEIERSTPVATGPPGSRAAAAGGRLGASVAVPATADEYRADQRIRCLPAVRRGPPRHWQSNGTSPFGDLKLWGYGELLHAADAR